MELNWGGRTVSVGHFQDDGVITVGTHADCDFVTPLAGSRLLKFPLVKIENGQVWMNLSPALRGRILTRTERVPFEKFHGFGLTTVEIGSESSAEIEFETYKLLVKRVSSEEPSRALPWFGTDEIFAVAATMAAAALIWVLLFLNPPAERAPPEKLRIARWIMPEKMPLEESVPSVTRIPVEDLPPLPSVPQPPVTQPRSNDSRPRVAGPPAPRGERLAPRGPPVTRPAGPPNSSLLNSLRNSSWMKNAEQTSILAQRSGSRQTPDANQPTGLNTEGGPTAGSTGTVAAPGINTGRGRPGDTGVHGGARIGANGLGERAGVTIDISGGSGTWISGDIDRAGIRRVIVASQSQIKACFDRSLNTDPDLHGKVVLSWDISGPGTASNVRVKESTVGAAQLENCLSRVISNLRFPAPPKDQVAEVTFPFVFLGSSN
ncbi:MAG: AgmX/PglI C-terminal domain-containing protein [Bdellovibrionia bacterium]